MRLQQLFMCGIPLMEKKENNKNMILILVKGAVVSMACRATVRSIKTRGD